MELSCPGDNRAHGYECRQWLAIPTALPKSEVVCLAGVLNKAKPMHKWNNNNNKTFISVLPRYWWVVCLPKGVSGFSFVQWHWTTFLKHMKALSYDNNNKSFPDWLSGLAGPAGGRTAVWTWRRPTNKLISRLLWLAILGHFQGNFTIYSTLPDAAQKTSQVQVALSGSNATNPACTGKFFFNLCTSFIPFVAELYEPSVSVRKVSNSSAINHCRCNCFPTTHSHPAEINHSRTAGVDWGMKRVTKADVEEGHLPAMDILVLLIELQQHGK